MPSRTKKRNMCYSKTRFRNLSEAETLADKYKQRVYYCPGCSNYHLTKQN